MDVDANPLSGDSKDPTMAFTGTATVKLVSDNLVRITGLSLAGAAVGTISLAEAAGADVECPAAFKPRTYKSTGGAVSLQDAVEVTLIPVTTITTLVPIMVVKTGTTLTNFVITLTNTTAATVSAVQEIWIRFH